MNIRYNECTAQYEMEVLVGGELQWRRAVQEVDVHVPFPIRLQRAIWKPVLQDGELLVETIGGPLRIVQTGPQRSRETL